MSSLPPGVLWLANSTGPEGPAGSVVAGDFVSIPAGEQGFLRTRKVGDVTYLDGFFPRGLPGTNGVANDTAFATYAAAEGSATHSALKNFLVARGTTVVGAITSPFLELEGNTGSAAQIHLTNGPGFTGPYQLGVGNNWGDTTGLMLANYAAGHVLYIDNHPESTGTAVFGAQRSDASLFDLVKVKDGAGALMVLRVGDDVEDAGGILGIFGVENKEVMSVDGGGDVFVRQRLRVIGLDGGDPAQILVQSAPSTPSSLSNGAWLGENALTFAAASGTAGNFFKTRISTYGSDIRIESGGGGAFSPDAPSWTPIIRVSADSKLAFFNGPPAPQQAAIANSGDTTVNAILNVLRAFSLIAT
jgi:hypothetical protein